MLNLIEQENVTTVNDTLALKMVTFATPEVLSIAQQAFTAHQKSVSTGDWAGFLALMSDEVEFHAPSPYLPEGWIQGKQNLAAILQKVTAELNLTAQLTLLHPIVTSEAIVAFEFQAEGQALGKPISARMVVFYEIENGKIKCVREYTSLFSMP